MKLVDLQKMASKGYSGGDAMGDYFNKKTGKPTKRHPGDTLEWIMAIEIAETFDPDATDEDQINEAMRVIQAGIRDLEGAVNSLMEGLKCQSKN